MIRLLKGLYQYAGKLRQLLWRIQWDDDCLEFLHQSAVEQYHTLYASIPYRLLHYKRTPPPPPSSLYARFLVDAMTYEPQRSWMWIKDFPRFFATTQSGQILGEVICAERDRISLQRKLRMLLDLPSVLDFPSNDGNAPVLIGYCLNGLRMTVPLDVADDNFANQVFGFVSMVTRQ